MQQMRHVCGLLNSQLQAVHFDGIAWVSWGAFGQWKANKVSGEV